VSSAASYFEIPRNQLLKSMVFRSGEALVMAVVRGDYEVSREKLARVVGKPIHGRAGPAQLQRFGLLGPWASPVGIPAMARGGITIAVDDAAADSTNFFSATNEPGVVAHNVNFGRDFGADLVADIVRIPAGSGCIHCGEGTLIRERAMELGNIFRLGDYYSKRMNLRVRRDGGRTIYPQMGSYGIGVGRLMTAIVDANRDERGIVWPMEVAPYHVFLMSIGKSLSVRELLEQLYDELGDGVLLDDRHASISHKLKDADLLGIPLRVVVSRDSLSTGTVELALRDQASTYRVQQDELVATVRSMIQERADV
jgi:prolyl-tRNA synthetase